MSHPTRQSFWQRFFLDTWYNKRWWAWLLLPVSWVYQIVSSFYAAKQKKQAVRLPVPVIVVGNISVGGTGKTPVIIALAKSLASKGIKVGVISRGYGSAAPFYPYIVDVTDNTSIWADVVGDEPLLVAQTTQCPVVIDSNRVSAAQILLESYPDTDVILSDDGLQHYRLARDLEIVVVDAERGLGNHFCLPAGPLREPARRLASVDWLLLNNTKVGKFDHSENIEGKEPGNKKATRVLPISLKPLGWRHLHSDTIYPLSPLPWDATDKHEHDQVVAVAGIGNPQRFFNSLITLGIEHKSYAYDDHYDFSKDDFSQWSNRVILMTEKDAVKCQPFASDNFWSLVVDVSLDDDFIATITDIIADR